jgi:hypothetical protein
MRPSLPLPAQSSGQLRRQYRVFRAQADDHDQQEAPAG